MICSMKKSLILFAAVLIGFSACEKIENVLDLTPESELSPDTYFKTATDLQLFTNTLYTDVIDHSVYALSLIHI